jgi:hypothetical protein
MIKKGVFVPQTCPYKPDTCASTGQEIGERERGVQVCVGHAFAFSCDTKTSHTHTHHPTYTHWNGAAGSGVRIDVTVATIRLAHYSTLAPHPHPSPPSDHTRHSLPRAHLTSVKSELKPPQNYRQVRATSDSPFLIHGNYALTREERKLETGRTTMDNATMGAG